MTENADGIVDGGTDTRDTVTTGLRYARPGDVQQTLDDAHSDGDCSRVHLVSGTEYTPRRTWDVWPGVTLDYAGATVSLTEDRDLHEVHPGAQVLDPVVGLRSVPGEYTSSVFRFDSERNGFYGENRSWHVRGGITRGRTGEGTVFEFAQGGERAIYFVHVDHAVWNVGTVVEMHRGDAFGINGNRIFGLWRGFERGIVTHNRERPDRSPENISGNQFDVIAQPKDSEILWDHHNGRYNVLRGRLWDFSEYADVMWRIHDGDTDRRNGNILRWFPVGGTADSVAENAVAAGVFDDQLGDPRNRVVVPWRQGTPVGEFSG